MSLYDVVHAPQPRKRDRKLHILIAIGLILVLAAFIPIPWAMHLQRQYRHFINGLGESVQYAKEQGGLYVRQDGRQFWSQDSASRLYLELNTAGMGKRQNSAPKSVPDAELEFGNGCILRLWEQDVWDGYNREWVPGGFIWYQGADGTNYMYDTDQVEGRQGGARRIGGAIWVFTTRYGRRNPGGGSTPCGRRRWSLPWRW